MNDNNNNNYQKLFISEFSFRCLKGAGLLIVFHYVISMATSIFSASIPRLLSPKFWLLTPFNSVPFIICFLIRLRPLAGAPSSWPIQQQSSIFGIHSLVLLGAWIVTFLMVGNAYFEQYSPEYLEFFQKVDDGGGLIAYELLPYPFVIVSVSVVMAIVGWFMICYKSGIHSRYHIKGHSLLNVVKKRFSSTHIRSLIRSSLACIAFFWIESIFGPPMIYCLYLWITKWLGDVKVIVESGSKIATSLWFDPIFMYHLWLNGLFSLAMFSCVEGCVELFFSDCFRLAIKSEKYPLIPTLLGGLRYPNGPIKQQATLECRRLCLGEEGGDWWLKDIFREFSSTPTITEDTNTQDDLPVSSELINIFISEISGFRKHLELLVCDLELFGEELRKRDESHTARDDGNAGKFNSQSEIFVPQAPSLFASIVKPIFFIFKSPAPTNQQYYLSNLKISGCKQIPQILTLDPPKRTKNTTTSSPTNHHHGSKIKNKYLSLTLALFGPFSTTYPGKLCVALCCELCKEWWICGEEVLVWTLDSLHAFMRASMDFDVHGQAQLSLCRIVCELVTLIEQLRLLERLPLSQQKSLSALIFAKEEQSSLPSEKRIGVLLRIVGGCLGGILDLFKDAIDDPALSLIDGGTKERLCSLGFLQK